MAEIIKKRTRNCVKKYELYFHCKRYEGYGGFAFPCDKDGKLLPGLTDTAKANCEKLMAGDPNYDAPVIREEKYVEISDAEAVCECGKKITLYDQYLGACECPYCGRWHTMSGEVCIPAEEWSSLDDW